ncbi:MAG TPA: hypothetical protein VNJ01_12465 [Bacteriovoracaceae bacterium]|nr:hypothetical protein [Bacteriovoracaceae bacterium]
MKSLMLLTFSLSLLALPAIAGETMTLCPMMKEQNDRSNPKLNLNRTKAKRPVKSSTSSIQ